MADDNRESKSYAIFELSPYPNIFCIQHFLCLDKFKELQKKYIIHFSSNHFPSYILSVLIIECHYHLKSNNSTTVLAIITSLILIRCHISSHHHHHHHQHITDSTENCTLRFPLTKQLFLYFNLSLHII